MTDVRSAPTPATPDDFELVRRAKDGNREAFECLYDRYASRLLLFTTRRRRGIEADAEDDVQHAFMKFFERLTVYEERGALFAYLLKLARSRRSKWWEFLVPVNELGVVASRAPSAEDLVGSNGEILLESTVLTLPQLDAVLLVSEGFSFQEAGEILGVSEYTAKSRRAAAIQKLLRAKLAIAEGRRLRTEITVDQVRLRVSQLLELARLAIDSGAVQ